MRTVCQEQEPLSARILLRTLSETSTQLSLNTHTHTLHTPFPTQSHHLLFDLRARPHGKTISRGRVQCIGFEEESPTKEDTHSLPPSNNFTACSNSTWRLVTRLNKTILHSQPAPRRSTGRRRRVAQPAPRKVGERSRLIKSTGRDPGRSVFALPTAVTNISQSAS